MSGEVDVPRPNRWEGNKAQRKELRTQVWGLRLNGYPFPHIAQVLGISVGFAHKLESEELELRGAVERETMRTQMMERVEHMRREALAEWERTKSPDAWKMWQWAEERLAKLLGLDAPVVTKAEVTTRDALDVELSDVLAQAAAAERKAREHQG